MLSSQQLITHLGWACSDNSLPLALYFLYNLQGCQVKLVRNLCIRDVMKGRIILHQGKHSSAVCCFFLVRAQEQVEHVNQACS